MMLDELRHSRRRLEEKRKQLSILNELHDNRVPKEILESVLGGLEELTVAESQPDTDALKERHDALTKELSQLNSQSLPVQDNTEP